MANGAMTLAEGSNRKLFKTDASIILNGTTQRQHVLRTTFDALSVWKAKYAINVSPFYPRLKTTIKEAALIDDDIWVFSVDATNAQNIIDAVTIAANFYKIQPHEILQDIYIKNLNSEGKLEGNLPLLLELNIELYKATAEAIRTACRHFGLREGVTLHVFSHNDNHKIPKGKLHDALISGGASSVTTDTRQFRVRINNNQGTGAIIQNTNLHVARLNL